MDYDVLILGGGLIGCGVAYELSKYNLNIAVIEKDYDIADDISSINTAVVNDGIGGRSDLMAKLQIMGNAMFDEITEKFDVPFKRIGSLLIANTEEKVKELERIYKRALKRGVKDIELVDGEKARKVEKNLREDVKMALYSKKTGLIAPYDLALAYAEIAFDNGVNFRLEEEVLDIQKISKALRVTTNKNKFTCKMVVNTTPSENYNIDKDIEPSNSVEKLNTFVLDNNYDKHFNHIIFSLEENDEDVYAIPTFNNNMIAQYISARTLRVSEILNKLDNLVDAINKDNIKDTYNEFFYRDMMIIDDNEMINKGYIKITGNHYGEVTITPAISNMVCETIVNNLKCKKKKNFIDKRREIYKFKNLTNQERNDIIKVDKNYGKIICLCNEITEAEIVDCIRRPLGARTIEGIKRRTGVTFGECQGAYCLSRIAHILARETGKNLSDIVKDSKGSRLLLSRIKEFDEI